MDSEITPAEFRRLQLQVDILQRFLTKTFGSSFLDFCKQAQLTITKGSAAAGNVKTLPPLNKAQVTTSNGTGGTLGHEIIKTEPGTIARSSSGAARRLPPPPLLHRPLGTLSVTPKGSTQKAATVSRGNSSASATTVMVDTGENEQEYYDEGNIDDDIAQFIQPETVFSDDEHGNSNGQLKKSFVNRNGTKRGHAVAFGYDENEALENGNNGMQLPEGTECIVLESEDDQGQHENYIYKQEEELYEYEDGLNNGEELYDEEGYSYMEDGMEVAGAEGGNYQTEELQTDGNVTFGTVITAQDTGIQYFQCAFCPSAKVFKHKQSLKEHYLLNHSPTPPAFQCQCGRRFLKQSQLKRHEVVHTAERPYVCPVCKKDFTRKDNMTVHMVRNHAEKKHPCPVCPDKIYATPAEVNRHLRMYHSQWQQ